MIIDSPDLLKQWLTAFLAPLCDADPEALAKYCLALVRKDRPVSELKASMIEQLDVFLQANTKSFVDKFLQVATARSYLPKRTTPSSTSSSSSTTTTTTTTTTTNTTTTPTTNSTGSATVKVEATSDTPGAPPLPPTPTKVSSGHSPDSTTPPNNVPPAVTTTQSPAASSITPNSTPAPSTSPNPTPPLPPPPASTVAVPPPPPPPESAPPPPPPLSVIVRKEEVTSSQRPNRKSESDRDRDDRRGRRRSPSRGRTRSRSRSGSRGRDRSRRSRSRGRRGKYDDRRRRSPISKRYRRSRTRSRTRSPRRSRSRDRKSRSRNRSRSLSPPPRVRPGRGRSPPPRSPSPPPRKAKSSPRDEKHDSPHRTSPGPEVKLEGHSDGPGGLLPSLVVNKQRTDFPPPPTTKKQRCRDYDEKGYCMRGDMCSFDHGSDPVVLEGISGVLDFPPPPVPPGAPPGYTPAPPPPQGVSRPRHPPPRHPQYEYTPREPSMWVNQPGPSQQQQQQPGMYYGGGGVDRGGPGGMGGPRFSAPPPPLPPTNARELISVPVNNGNHIGGMSGNVGPSLAKRLGPVLSGGPGGGGVGKVIMTRPDHDSCTLELRKIPPGLNTIAHLNDHFSKFGTVINIQVHHEGSPESALVTFSGHSEANAAYRSTEAVLNNRFIKVFWHNPQNKVGSGLTYPHHHLSRPLQERLGARHPNKTFNKLDNTDDKSEKVLLSRGSLVKTVYNTHVLQSSTSVTPNTTTTYIAKSNPQAVAPTTTTTTSTLSPNAPEFTPQLTAPIDIKKQEIEAILKQQELLAAEIAAKQIMEKQKAETKKLKSEVEQRKRQLLEKQMQQLKVLVSKLEDNKGSMKSEEKRKLLVTIKSLQVAIDSTRNQLVSGESGAAPVPRTKQQLDKEILDTELELYGVQAEGGDTNKMRLRLGQLRAQQQAYGYPPTRSIRHSPYVSSRGGAYVSRGRGVRGVVRGRGRGTSMRGYGHSFSTVDRRPTKINASGFEREDKDEVLTHFAALGKVSNYIWDGQTPAVTIQYSTRREAEKAMIEGRTLGDRLLTITWAFDASPTSPQLPPSHLPFTQSSMVTSKLPQSQHCLSPQPYVVPTPHSTTPLLSPDETMEEITEEIVEEVETEEADHPGIFEEEEEVEEEDEEEVRSWRR